MKKYIALFICTVLLFQLFGMTCIYFSQRYDIRNNISAVINHSKKSSLLEMKLSNLDFELSQFEENELLIDGKMYDIVEQNHIGNNVFVKLYHDKKDESLLKNVLSWFDAKSDANSAIPKLVLKMFFSPFVLSSSIEYCFNLNFHHHFLYRYNLQFNSNLITPPTPPPLSVC